MADVSATDSKPGEKKIPRLENTNHDENLQLLFNCLKWSTTIQLYFPVDVLNYYLNNLNQPYCSATFEDSPYQTAIVSARVGSAVFGGCPHKPQGPNSCGSRVPSPTYPPTPRDDLHPSGDQDGSMEHWIFAEWNIGYVWICAIDIHRLYIMDPPSGLEIRKSVADPEFILLQRTAAGVIFYLLGHPSGWLPTQQQPHHP